MEPLFVSYKGNRNGLSAEGWIVLRGVGPLTSGNALEVVLRLIADLRGYDPDSMIAISFRRMEAENAE